MGEFPCVGDDGVEEPVEDVGVVEFVNPLEGGVAGEDVPELDSVLSLLDFEGFVGDVVEFEVYLRECGLYDDLEPLKRMVLLGYFCLVLYFVLPHEISERGILLGEEMEFQNVLVIHYLNIGRFLL